METNSLGGSVSQPSELLRIKYENNLLRTELTVRQLQEQLDLSRKALLQERKAIVDEMRREVGAPGTAVYNRDSQTFE